MPTQVWICTSIDRYWVFFAYHSMWILRRIPSSSRLRCRSLMRASQCTAPLSTTWAASTWSLSYVGNAEGIGQYATHNLAPMDKLGIVEVVVAAQRTRATTSGTGHSPRARKPRVAATKPTFFDGAYLVVVPGCIRLPQLRRPQRPRKPPQPP